MTLREQFERLLRATLLVFVLAAVAFLSAVTTIRMAIRGRVVTMPDLIGKPASQAQRLLAARRLGLRVADRTYSSMPQNVVVRQSPPPGEQVKISQDAQVVLSLGPQTASVPALGGTTERAARISLIEAGLQLGEVSTVDLPSVAESDTVLQQYPRPGKTAASPSVDLLVAQGKRPVSYVMPSLIGMMQQEADHVLEAAKLRVPQHTYISQAGAPKGTVIGQTPPRGARVDADAAIELGISE